MVYSFDLSRTLPAGGGLLVLCSLLGPPVIKQLMQMVTMMPGQGGRFPNSNPLQYSCLENPLDRGIWQARLLAYPNL